MKKTIIVCRVLTAVFILLTGIVIARYANKEKAYRKWLEEKGVEILEESPAEKVYLREYPLVEAKTVSKKEEIEEMKEDLFIVNLDIPLAAEYQEHLHNECERIGVSEAYMYALMETESSFRPGVVGDGGKSFGLCQIKSVNWPEMEELGLNHENEFDCITYAVTLIRRYMDKYSDSLNLMNVCTTCYKCGEAGAKRNNYYLNVCEEIERRTEYYAEILK